VEGMLGHKSKTRKKLYKKEHQKEEGRDKVKTCERGISQLNTGYKAKSLIMKIE